MADIFIKIFNLSITASWIVLAVLILRLLLRKAPKWISCLMWGIVGLRLALPFSIESVLSLIPSAEPIPSDIASSSYPAIDSGIKIVDNVVNPIISDSFAPVAEQSTSPMQALTDIAAYVWLVGLLLMIVYGAVSYLRLRLRVAPSMLLRDKLYFCDNIDTPFILGIIRPKIYIPSTMNEEQIGYVSEHEYAHIKRRDHLIKPLGFLLLSVYWFNPVIWLAYVLLCRDIEKACDEKVIKNMSDEAKKGYSETLFACSVHRKIISACPLAFGEVGVKDRIKSVLSYKKPAFWIIIAAVVASLTLAVCFLTSPLGSGSGTINKIVKQRGYKLVGQEDSVITLSIDKSLLPDSIYSEKGQSFKKDEVIAYQDNTTTIYLKSAQYANEGNDKLYFCFDFSYDLPKKGGKALYPYEILNNGIEDSVATIDKVLRDTTNHYDDAVSVRGQGSGTKIWFYVSTDALRQASGKIEFDVKLNLITYLKNGENMLSVLDSVHTDYEGVYMTLKSTTLSDSGDMIFKVDWHNDTDKEITFGAQYTIEYKNGNEWVSVDTEKERYWIAIAYLIQPNGGTHEITYSAKGFDLSKVGRYRVISHFYADNEKKYTWIEFDVTNDTDEHNAERLEALKRDYPEYFDIDDTNGIYLYVWQMSADSYKCGLLPIKDTDYSLSDPWGLKGISVEDMKLILKNEYADSEVMIIPYSMPHSSYYYEINDEYRNKVEALFGKNKDTVTGVYGSIESVNSLSNGTKVLNVVWYNNTDGEVLFGEFFTVEYKDGENWVNICTADERRFPAIALVLRPHTTYKKSYSTHEFDMSRQGTYRLRCDLGQVLFEIGGKEGLDETAKGEYNGVKILSGNKETIPLSSFTYARSYEEHGWLSTQGSGKRAFFDSNGNFAAAIPTLRCDGNIKLNLSDRYYSFSGMKVYDLSHNEIKISGSDFDNLNDLSRGDYYVVMTIKHQGDYVEVENAYEEIAYDYIFGIIIK